MSKRPLGEITSSNSSKRVRRSMEEIGLVDSQGDDHTSDRVELFNGDNDDGEAFLNDPLKTKIGQILTKAANEEKISQLNELIREIMGNKSKDEKKKLSVVFDTLFEYLISESTGLSDKLAVQLASLLALQIELVPIVVLKNSVELFISSIKSQKPVNEKCMDFVIEIFKMVKKKLPSEDEASGKGGKKKDQAEQNEFMDRKIAELMNIRWTQATSMNVVLLFKDLQLNKDQFKRLLEKLFDLAEMTWQSLQIPTLINSILSFSYVQSPSRVLMFEKMLQFFAESRRRRADGSKKTEYIDAESLSILHIIHYIKTDHSQAKDLLKVLKSKLNWNLVDLIQPFTFGLVLSLLKVLPPQDGVRDLLKQIANRIYESDMKWRQFYWISRTYSDEEKQLASQLVSTLKPSKCPLLASDHILPNLIEFVFDILDNYGVRMTRTTKPTNQKEHMTVYASEMIRDLFKNVGISRGELLTQLTDRIFSCTIMKSIVFIDQLAILIQSEPAAYFQDFFRKFKSKLDHMINMTPIVALEFLTAIKPLLKYDSVYKDALIGTLKKSIYQTDLNVRKVGLNGLICLLTTTKLSGFLPSSQASQSFSLSQSQSQMSRASSMSQSGRSAEKNCLEMFLSLRRCLTQQCEIRAKLYQSCCSLIVQNTTLVGPTLNLLLINLENYLTKTEFDIILELGKCFRVSDGSGEIEITEPIDILLHALHLCEDKYTRGDMQSKFQDQLDEDIKKHSDVIRTYFEQLKQSMIQVEPKHLLETYQSQVKLMVMSKKSSSLMPPPPIPSTAGPTQNRLITINTSAGTDLNTYSPFYQCLLGTIEVLIEHFFMNGNFKSMRDLYKKFSLLHDLVQKQFTQGTESTGQAAKRKATPSAKKTTKKTKKSDKENKAPGDDEAGNETLINEDDIRASAQDQSRMADMTTMENPPLLESTTNVGKKGPAAKKSKPGAKKSLDYVHRISFSCLQYMIKIYFGKNLKHIKGEHEKTMDQNDETMDEFLMQMKLEDSFHDYLIQVLNQQLESILNETNLYKVDASSSSTNSNVRYDCESYDDRELFKYLQQIWTTFWKQVSDYKCGSSDCSQNDYYCEDCIKQNISYIKILSQIWLIVAIRFNPKVNELFSFSVLDSSATATQDSMINSSNMSSVAVGILDLCRRFIDKCLLSHSQFIANALKLATQIIDLMYLMGNSVTLQVNDYGMLFKWVQSLTLNESISDQTFCKELFKFFIFITWNKNSSAALMKYICQDLIHLFGVSKGNLSETLAETERCFMCLTNENATQIVQVMNEEIVNILSQMDWFITFKQDYGSMNQLYKQLNSVLECFTFLLKIDTRSGSFSQEQLIKILCKFYGFMITLCKNVTARSGVTEDEIKLLKSVVDVTAVKMQNSLNQFIRHIQNAKSSASKEKDKKQKGKDDAGSSSTKVLKCAKMIPNLVYQVEQYEQQLKMLSKHFKNEVDFMEKFELCIRDFKINLPQADEDDDDDIASSITVDSEETRIEATTSDHEQEDDEE